MIYLHGGNGESSSILAIYSMAHSDVVLRYSLDITLMEHHFGIVDQENHVMTCGCCLPLTRQDALTEDIFPVRVMTFRTTNP